MKPVSKSIVAKEQLRVIGKISLLLAALTTLALAAFSGLLKEIPDGDYSTTVGTLALLKGQLDQFMVFGALGLVTLTAITTWVMALYSSFRVAGPLFRLARNLERLTECRNNELLPLRAGDRLQLEAAELKASQHALIDHYDQLEVAIQECHRKVVDGADYRAIAVQVSELRRVAAHAKI